MNDRELLELAAKACGYDTSHPWNTKRLDLDPPVIGLCIDGVSTNWNPLEDDGDALRLAVHLFQDIHFWYYDNSISVGNNLRVPCRSDPVKAARRAIVRAAAEIGKSKSWPEER